jgi:hypothetical protein
MARIVHFELPYDDGGRARKFYEDVFGWQVQGGVGWSAVLRDPEGNTLGLFESEESVPEEGS